MGALVEYSALFRGSWVLATCLIAGCLSVAPPVTQVGPIQKKEEKNYTLNTAMTVYVGDPVIVRRSYLYRETERSDVVVASNDFVADITGLGPTALLHRGTAGEELRVAGTTTTGNRRCRIIDFGLNDRYGVRVGMLVSIDTDLSIGEAVAVNGFGYWSTVGWGLKLDRPDTRFEVGTRLEVLKDKPYENWDMIYTGPSGSNITLVYREYTPDDLAKPAFFQNLTYNLDDGKTIQFRKFRFEVLRATNQAMTFEVLSDS